MIILFSTVEGMLALPGLQEDFSREITMNRIIDLKFPEPHAKLSVGVAGWGRHPWSISTSSERELAGFAARRATCSTECRDMIGRVPYQDPSWQALQRPHLVLSSARRWGRAQRVNLQNHTPLGHGAARRGTAPRLHHTKLGHCSLTTTPRRAP
jgi:hypothetical protein